MQCRVAYSTQFLDENFSKKFRKETLQNVRDVVIIEREKQVLPQLMHRASAYVKYMKIHSEIANLWNTHHNLSTEIMQQKNTLHNSVLKGTFDEERMKQVIEMKALVEEMETNLAQI
jgi:hypothetical protein